MHIALIYSKFQDLDQSSVSINLKRPSIMKNTVRSIQKALEANHHTVVAIEANTQLLETLENNQDIDLLFNLSTGISDKRSQANIVGLLEMTQIPMVGSGLATHVLALHKEMTKSLLKAHNIPTARFQLIYDETDTIRKDMNFPLIVKPEHEGSGIGITETSVVHTPVQLKETIQ
ncbi:MAG TPA: hypothetical protein VK048_03775 [Atopostipes sp.]|nr:hypothetical protein [Atopostipes sp.]